MKTASFLKRSSERRFHADWSGDVFIWDIDKTYLDTRFSSLRGLLAIPFEQAVDKRAVRGTVPLLRALRHGADEQSALCPLYFISGSPHHLRGVVERKMTLDGVQFDGITFKDQFGLLKALRPRSITEQIGYKLKALLLYRAEHPAGARYLLFGDDVERDMDIFLLFGAICAGLRGRALAERLRDDRVHENDIVEVLTLADAIERGRDPVEHIFIHAVRGTASSPDPRVHVARSYLDHARTLRALGKIRELDVSNVRAEVEA